MTLFGLLVGAKFSACAKTPRVSSAPLSHELIYRAASGKAMVREAVFTDARWHYRRNPNKAVVFVSGLQRRAYAVEVLKKVWRPRPGENLTIPTAGLSLVLIGLDDAIGRVTAAIEKSGPRQKYAVFSRQRQRRLRPQGRVWPKNSP